MGTKCLPLMKPMRTAVDLAVAALDGNPNPLDMDMNGIDPDPTSLDLPEVRPRRGGGPASGDAAASHATAVRQSNCYE